jgi:2C-methyl-D-erythritol 2,4-cyclodiphosphate synthase
MNTRIHAQTAITALYGGAEQIDVGGLVDDRDRRLQIQVSDVRLADAHSSINSRMYIYIS